MSSTNRLLSLSPLKIAGGYLVFGIVWILLSDRAVLLITDSQAQTAQLQTIKGWLFVGGSALLVLGLTRTRERQIQSSQNRLNRATQELQVLHRVFRHNIRNNLNVVLGYIDSVREVTDANEIQELLNIASTSTQQVIDTSEKLRLLERTELRPTKFDAVDVVAIIQREVEKVESIHPDLTIEADLPEEARISGDQSFGLVIRELLENAIEHHHLPEHEREIAVSVQQSLLEVTIRIADNGPGIHEDELAALTKGEETQLVHMSGVGLWLVKWMCGLYAGEISITSEPDGGTVVTLECPAASPIEGIVNRARSGAQAEVSAAS